MLTRGRPREGVMQVVHFAQQRLRLHRRADRRRFSGQQSAQAQRQAEREQAKADKKRIRELERELRRKDKALAEAAAILVLRKKLNAYWGSDSEDN